MDTSCRRDDLWDLCMDKRVLWSVTNAFPPMRSHKSSHPRLAPFLRESYGMKNWIGPYRLSSTNFLGGTMDSSDIPVDGFDVWGTIAKGAPSPRTEILLNIDFPQKRPGLLLTYDTWYSGAAIRVGDMKLLMHVPNATWYQTPEDGGIAPPMEDIWVTVWLFIPTSPHPPRPPAPLPPPPIFLSLPRKIDHPLLF